MEPRFSLPASTPRSSRTELVIGGVQIYIYGLDELQQKSGVDIAVLYLAHMRTRTYRVTEDIAHEVLHRYRTDERRKKCELIAITMDMRNHGDRLVSQRANLTWRDGNENHRCPTKGIGAEHSIDLLSTISGSAQDFMLVLDYLPAYLPQFTRFHNIMAGISLGAHTAYRMGSLAPGQLSGFIIIVGCPDLNSLLLSRLGINSTVLGSSATELDTLSYDRLKKLMTEQQKLRWPRALAELVQEGDRKVYEDFPSDVPILICNGKQDPLVPVSYTASWLEKRRRQRRRAGLQYGGEDTNIDFFVQENTGHSCTKEMVSMMAVWLGDMFEAKNAEISSVFPESHL